MIFRFSRRLALTAITGLIGLASPVCFVSAATFTADSANFADVDRAVTNANRGDTVMVPQGIVNWGTQTLTLTKGINLIGAGRDSTFITGTNSTDNTSIILISPDLFARTHGEEIRIEGFTFDGNNTTGTTGTALIRGSTEFGIKTVIGVNRFRNTGPMSVAINLRGQTRGVIYKNLFDRCNIILRPMGLDTLDEWVQGFFPFGFGSADNLFFEDNEIFWSSPMDAFAPGWCESGQSGRVVYRYNRWDFANAKANGNTTSIEIIDSHGFQGWNIPPAHVGQSGTMIVEVYGNTIVNSMSNRFIIHRGSWGMFHNNLLSGGGLLGISAQQYGSTDAGGSGCQGDVQAGDARAATIKTQINNTYTFNNLVDGAMKNMGAGAVYGCGIAENTDYFNLNPNFDGSSGIGTGTSAPGGNPKVGVGYWKASTPTTTTDPAVVQSGVFYKCVVPGEWTEYYKPYTYPHPLAHPRPAPPTNTHVVPKP